ncbi:MAG: zinc-ribbon domain-containing protein [Clostridia bacterium]|nr:zinc-ribbon domain-containing protein [Clostridia bacterium]
MFCVKCGAQIQDGSAFCSSCGNSVNGEAVQTNKSENNDELKNLYMIARRAKDDDNSESAAKYYDMILVKDPLSWEATFYVVYFKAMQCKIINIQSAAVSVSNCVDTVFALIKDNVTDKEEQKAAYTEVATRVILISQMLYNAAKNHYDGIDFSIRSKYQQEYLNRAFAAFRTMYSLGNHLDTLFSEDSEANKLAVAAWKSGIDLHKSVLLLLQDKAGNQREILSYAEKIKKYDQTYVAPDFTTTNSSGGCYVATAVYGSYDCPEVWTLRRFRDDTLAETWYGRAFIRTYYAISPTLVKWFGETEWFKNMWKPTLDKMVKDLNDNGVDNTAYNDREW